MTILLIFILSFKVLLNREIKKSYIKSTLGINYLKLESKIFSQKFNFKKTNQKLAFSTYFRNFWFEYNFNNENFYTKFEHSSKISKIELRSKNFNFISLNSCLNFGNIKVKVSKYNSEIELFKKFNNLKVVSNLKNSIFLNKKLKISNKFYYFKDGYKICLNLSNFNKFTFNINLKNSTSKFSINTTLENRENSFSIRNNLNFLFSHKIQNLKFYFHLRKTFYLSLKASF